MKSIVYEHESLALGWCDCQVSNLTPRLDGVDFGKSGVTSRLDTRDRGLFLATSQRHYFQVEKRIWLKF